MEPGAISLKATGRGRRRLLVNRVAEGSAVLAAVLAIAVLAIVLWAVGSRGIGAINLDFFLKGPSSDFFGGKGGIAPALAGSLLLVGVATADRPSDRSPDGDLRERIRARLAPGSRSGFGSTS